MLEAKLKTFCLSLMILFSAGTLWADTPLQGIFKSVKGEVLLRAHQKWVHAKKDETVVEGQRILTKDGSEAVLGLFDGSELTIAANTEFTLTALQKPSGDSKVLKFKLFWGQLSAIVQKLTTSNSSFEIESGGVVCGVRGTAFSVFNNGAPKPVVNVVVTSGTVWTNCGGNQFIMHAGDHMNFMNGNVLGGNNNNNGNNNNGKKNGANTSGSSNGSSNGSGNGSSNGSSNGSGSSSGSGSNGSSSNSATGSTGSSNGTSNGSGTGTGGSGTGSTGTSGGGSTTGGGTGTTGAGLPGAPGAGAPPVGGTGDTNSLTTSGLADLNHQFQSGVLINNDNTITNPVVLQALQLNVVLTVGK